MSRWFFCILVQKFRNYCKLQPRIEPEGKPNSFYAREILRCHVLAFKYTLLNTACTQQQDIRRYVKVRSERFLGYITLIFWICFEIFKQGLDGTGIDIKKVWNVILEICSNIFVINNWLFMHTVYSIL